MKTYRYALTDDALARACHVCRRSIVSYKKDPTFPKKEPGRGWNVKLAQDWVSAQKERLESEREAARAAGRTLDEAKIGKYLIETDRIRLKYEHERGQMTTAAEYREFVRDMCALVMETIDRMVSGVSAKLRDPEVLRIMETEATAAREYCARKAEEKEGDRDSVGDLPDGQP